MEVCTRTSPVAWPCRPKARTRTRCRTCGQGDWPFLFAERVEYPSRPTVLGYGHGDVVRGLDDRWHDGLSPWLMTEREGRWYGRSVADNKGQHSINLGALRAVLE